MTTSPTPDRVTALYDAIDAFQRKHRTVGGLQHAQIRALLAEHLHSALPAESAGQAPATDRAALRDRIADVLAETDGWVFAPGFKDGSPTYRGFLRQADAVLAVLPAPADQAAVIARVREVVRRLAAHAVGFTDVLDETDRGPWGKTVAADIAELRRMVDEDAPLSPFYEHPECGFRWHGRDDMDIPMRDGQPVCPRCELAKVTRLLEHSSKRREEVGAECKRRGKRVLEQAEQIRALERQIDEVRGQLGAEILRAEHAGAEVERLTADQAAVRATTLHEGADAIASHPGPHRGDDLQPDAPGFWWDTRDRDAAADLLRRMADEAQPTQTEADEDLPARLKAVLTERYTALGNPFSEMRRRAQGPDGWPASHPVGPHHVAEALRELLAPPSAGPGTARGDETRSLPCSGGILRQPHDPHTWEPQPGMTPVHCPGAAPAKEV